MPATAYLSLAERTRSEETPFLLHTFLTPLGSASECFRPPSTSHRLKPCVTVAITQFSRTERVSIRMPTLFSAYVLTCSQAPSTFSHFETVLLPGSEQRKAFVWEAFRVMSLWASTRSVHAPSSSQLWRPIVGSSSFPDQVTREKLVSDSIFILRMKLGAGLTPWSFSAPVMLYTRHSLGL